MISFLVTVGSTGLSLMTTLNIIKFGSAPGSEFVETVLNMIDIYMAISIWCI